MQLNKAVFSPFFVRFLSVFSVFQKLRVVMDSSKLRGRCGNDVQYVSLIRLLHFGHNRQVVQLPIAISKLRKTEKSEKLDKNGLV